MNAKAASEGTGCPTVVKAVCALAVLVALWFGVVAVTVLAIRVAS